MVSRRTTLGIRAINHKEIVMLTQLKKLWKDEEGATAVEYGLMVAAIAAVIIAVVVKLGGQVNDAFTKVSDGMPKT